MRDDLDSPGAVLFRRFAGEGAQPPRPGRHPRRGGHRLARRLHERRSTPNDAVNTPNGLNTGSPGVRAALADAVKELRDIGIPLDARLRDWQYELRGDERIPIHGGPGGLGVFNAISAPFAGAKGFPDIGSGSSFVMAAHLTGGCPRVARDPHLLAVRQPRVALLRRPDAALLAEALARPALLRGQAAARAAAGHRVRLHRARRPDRGPRA